MIWYDSDRCLFLFRGNCDFQINFEKLRMIAKEIRHIVNMSSSPYVSRRKLISKGMCEFGFHLQDISNMFDSPTSHSQIFAGFGHQSTTDSYGTIRRHQTGMRLSIAANAKRIYDEVKRILFVLQTLNSFFAGINGEKSENILEQCRNH